MKKKYKNFQFNPERSYLIAHATKLIDEYVQAGERLTLRQLYYRFIALELFPESWRDKETKSKNNERNYKRLGELIADARMAGLISWTALEDRTRELGSIARWDYPAEILTTYKDAYRIDRWAGQRFRVEIWVEKDAMEGVVSRAALALDCNYFSCRGYTSLSSIWEAGMRLRDYERAGQTPVVVHLGDHDPSGVDMSRDIEDRLKLFMAGSGGELVFNRIALTMDQVRQYNPPPNYAKVTDSRYKGYTEVYGEDCWELDALESRVVRDLIRQTIESYLNKDLYDERVEQEETERKQIALVAGGWDKAVKACTPKPPRKRKKK